MSARFRFHLKQLFSAHPILKRILTARIIVYYPCILPFWEVIKINNYNTRILSIVLTAHMLFAPFTFFFLARRSKKPFKFEKRLSMNLEMLLMGIWLPVLKFNPLIALLYINNAGVAAGLGGIKLFITRIITTLVGIAIGSLVFGIAFNSEINFILVVYSGVSFAIITFMTGYLSYKTSMQVSETKTLLKKEHKKTNIAHQQLRKELSEASDYVKSIIPDPITGGPVQARWKFIPSESLGGDGIGYHWIDNDHFAFYLIDVSGHGVGAALLAVSVINSVRAQSLSGVDFLTPSEVLDALNCSYPSEKHNGMFFTMWYGVYSLKNRELLYSSAGHPPGLFLVYWAISQTRRIITARISLWSFCIRKMLWLRSFLHNLFMISIEVPEGPIYLSFPTPLKEDCCLSAGTPATKSALRSV